MFTRNEIRGMGAPTRKAYPWHQMEEYRPDGGMWKIPPEDQRQAFIQAAALLMSDPEMFAGAMREALSDWPRSVEVALTNPGLNQRAWLGHAGCYLVTGSPEETTRLGWHLLDDNQQYDANAAADLVIAEWRECNRIPEPEALF